MLADKRAVWILSGTSVVMEGAISFVYVSIQSTVEDPVLEYEALTRASES
jgi:hypothetical protein